MIKKIKLLLRVTFGLIVFCLTWYAFQRVLSGSREVVTFQIPELQPKLTRQSPILKVGAYNIAHGRGGTLGESNWNSTGRKAGEAHLAKIAAQISAEELDVLILNEVDFNARWSGGLDQARFLSAQSGFPYIAELSNIDITLPFFTLRFGNAILSKRPLNHVRAIELPSINKWEPLFAGKKNAIEATLFHNEKPIRIVAIHLESRSEETRLRSAEILLDKIHYTDTPHILLGDFNSQRTVASSTAVDMLIDDGKFTSDVDFSTWKTFPSQSPERGIDWILTNTPLSPSNSKIVESKLSDHFMITSEIQIGE